MPPRIRAMAFETPFSPTSDVRSLESPLCSGHRGVQRPSYPSSTFTRYRPFCSFFPTTKSAVFFFFFCAISIQPTPTSERLLTFDPLPLVPLLFFFLTPYLCRDSPLRQTHTPPFVLFVCPSTSFGSDCSARFAGNSCGFLLTPHDDQPCRRSWTISYDRR